MPDPLPSDPSWQDRALGLDLLRQGMGGDPGLPTAEERRYGTDLLKRHMLEDIGIDVERPRVYDDSPTVKEYTRRMEDPTRPNVFNLQQEIDRQYGPDSQYGVVPRPRTIQLAPVDHDPYNPTQTLQPVDHDPFPSGDNMAAAHRELGLNPQEAALYRRHLTNLYGPGGVDNPDGSRSTLYEITAGIDGRTYVLPTVYDGKILPPEQAVARARQEGLQNFPSYDNEEQATQRYDAMHRHMERDTGAYFASRAPATLVPVEGDPWSAAGAVAPEQFTEADREMVRRAGRAVLAPIDAFFGAPSRAAAPNPYPPGSEEWQFYENSRTANIERAGPEMALDMVGGGAPAAERGALGVAGGRPWEWEQAANRNIARTAQQGAEMPPSILKNLYAPEHITPYEHTWEHMWKEGHPESTSPADFSDEWFKQKLAEMHEATSPKVITPRAREIEIDRHFQNLKPFEWQPQMPLSLSEEHPAAREAYESLMADPERTKRAYMQGFNVNQPLFKGGYLEEGLSRYPETIPNPAEAKRWERGLFLADRPEVAKQYGDVTPYLARAQKAHEIDWHEATGNPEYSSYDMHNIVEAGHRKGADMLVIRNIRDMGGKQDQYVVLDPSILRAPHAKFDYDKLKHAMPLAGIAGGGAIVLDQDGDIVHYIKGRRQ